MTDAKRHLLDIVAYNAVEAMDLKDLVDFAQNTLFEFYAQWSEQELKHYLDENWPLDE
jgi:hypothetical protein